MEIHPKEDLPFVVEQFEKQARKEIVFAKNIPMKRKNGSVFYADINSVPMVLAGKTYLMGSFRNITERKEAEDALKESEGKLRSIVENSSDQIFMVDKDCKYLSINKIAADLCRKSPQEMIGVSIFEIFSENIAVQFSKNIKNVFDTCKSMFIEEKMVMQGRELYYSTALNPVQDGSGRVIAVTGIVRDITKDKEAEEEIRYLKDYNENILESNPNPMMVVKGKQIEYINKSFISIFGKTKDEFIKRNLKDVIPLEIFPVFENLSQETGISKELKFRGKEYTVSSFVIKKAAAAEEEEEDVRKGIVFQDITERKQAEKEREKILQWQQGVNTLQQSLLAPAPLEDKLKTITDSVVRFFDADFCRIWLTQPGDLCEQGCTHAEVHEGPHVCRYRDRCLRLRASSGRYTHTDGKTHRRVPFGCYKIGCVASGEDHKFLTNDVQNDPRVHNNDWARELGLVSFAGYQLRVPGGQIIGVVALFAKHLITPAEDTILDGISNAVARVVQQSIADEKVRESTKKIELQNIQLKKLDKIKSDFLNITSHELRTPMSAIKGYTQMIFKQKLGQITEEQQQALTVVLRNTDRLDNLIRDILDISRLESGTMKFVPEKTNHGKMVEEAIETMQPTAELKKIKINTEIENDIPEMMVDPERIKQVIINIVNNAIKFSPNGTTINVRTKKENDKILFEIQDFGRGIPKDKQEKIFEIFYQVDSGMDRKFGGAGLGLAISRGIILSHGGNIWVESEPDKGSTFRFTLPITPVQDLEGKFRDVDIFKLKDSKRAMENDLRDKTVVWDEPGEKRGEKT
jgi:PAS domain S-box-containing protein